MIIAAAILPLGGMFSADPTVGASPWIDGSSWLVFLVDLVVHVRLGERYLRTRRGWFDLGIVLLTFPWYLVLPGAGGSDVLALARLARVARIAAVAAKGSGSLRRLGARVGKAAAYAGVITLVSALIVDHVEPPEAGFETIGDSLWWAVVTITTVGYGDLFPTTGAGRITGAILMVAGLAFLGAVAGSLAAFLGLEEDTAEAQPEPARDDGAILEEIRELRAEVASLGSSTGSRPVAPEEPTGGTPRG